MHQLATLYEGDFVDKIDLEFIVPLDAMKLYQIYFPKFNFSNVEQKYNKAIQKNLDNGISKKNDQALTRIQIKKLAPSLAASQKGQGQTQTRFSQESTGKSRQTINNSNMNFSNAVNLYTNSRNSQPSTHQLESNANIVSSSNQIKMSTSQINLKPDTQVMITSIDTQVQNK